MNTLAVMTALEERFRAPPTLGLIVWENQDAEPARPYLIWENVRTGTRDDALTGGTGVSEGYVMVKVVTDTDQFATAGLSIAETVADRFAYGLRMGVTGGGHVLVYKPPYVMQGFTDGTNWLTPVRIDYQAFGGATFITPPVPPATSAPAISADAGNVINAGTDGGLYSPDPEQDFVTAGEALGGGRIVTVAGLYAQAGTYNLILGVTTGAVLSGVRATVRLSGAMADPAWTWTPGGAIFAAPNGIMTQTVPTTGTLRRIGFAVNATSILIDIQPSIVLG